jgi:release factor glutamine methyltransferase
VTSIGELWRWATGELANAGIEQPQRDARLLLESIGGFSSAQIIAFPERNLDAGQCSAFRELIARRKSREPVSRILGRREFWSLPFKVSQDTLDPRPDSETLVEAVLDRIVDRRAEVKLLDFGTGTGCLLLALLSELPQAQGIGIDLNPGAVAVAGENAAALGFADRTEFRVGDWGKNLEGRFDIIVSNPPYIEATAIQNLDPEVANHDPHLALSGGPDGLDAYRMLLPEADRLLAPDGWIALEIGQGQGDSVRRIAASLGLRDMGSKRDLAGIERCLMFGKS